MLALRDPGARLNFSGRGETTLIDCMKTSVITVVGGGDDGADPCPDWKDPDVVLVTLEGEADEELGDTKFPLNPGAFEGSAVTTGVASKAAAVIGC